MIGPLERDNYYKWFHGILYNILSFLAFSSHMRAMLSDPVSEVHSLVSLLRVNIGHESLKYGKLFFKICLCFIMAVLSF